MGLRRAPRFSLDRAKAAAVSFAHEEMANGQACSFEVLSVRRASMMVVQVELREHGLTTEGGAWTLDFKVYVRLEHGKIVASAKGHVRVEAAA